MQSNESLLNALHEAASRLSYYNACDDGTQRMREEKDRMLAWDHWKALRDEAIARGVYKSEDFRNYLV